VLLDYAQRICLSVQTSRKIAVVFEQDGQDARRVVQQQADGVCPAFQEYQGARFDVVVEVYSLGVQNCQDLGSQVGFSRLVPH